MSPLRQSIACDVKEHHDVGDARRQATALAIRTGFNETEAGRVSIVVTELATNLVKHGGGGQIVMRALETGRVRGIEVMALDKGTGFQVETAMRDGYSTAGSPGTGLGAIQRMSSQLDIYSLPNKGSVLVATIWDGKPPSQPLDVGAICVPLKGERACGDAWAIRSDSDLLHIMVSDGLGHGILAAEASDIALSRFADGGNQAPNQLLRTLHGALQPTRGAAVAVFRADGAEAAFAGVGNIGGQIFSGTKSRGMVSHNGIVGHQAPRISEFAYPYGWDDIVVMHSDGLAAHWKMEDYPGLAFRSAALIAAVFYRDFKRPRDDATIVVSRRAPR